MSFNGVRLFRYALLGESALNIASLLPMWLYPEGVATLLFKSPEQITPAAKSLIQWFVSASQSPSESLRGYKIKTLTSPTGPAA